MNKLQEILNYKKIEVENLKKSYELINKKLSNLETKPNKKSFSDSIYNPNYLSIIAEIKRKSPSSGIINQDDDPLYIAKLYQDFGFSAISILTDNIYFGGSFELLFSIANYINLPILCKDFIIDKVQVDLAKIYGASSVLLITEALNDNDLLSLYEYSLKLNLDVLLEAHFKENIIRAIQLGAKIIGINNRNLITLEENYKYSIIMRDLLPDNVIKLSLSGINDINQIYEIANCNYDGVLIGTFFMKSINQLDKIK